MSGVKCTNDHKGRILPFLLLFCILIGGCGRRIEGSVSFLPYQAYDFLLPSETVSRTAGISGFSSDLCVLANENTSTENTDAQTCHAAAVFNLETKEVPFAYNIFDQIYPASTTKIMTLLVACENGNPEDEVTVSHEAASQPSDSSICGIKEGEVYTLKDLMYGMMLKSGNDAATAIAEHVGGSVEAFADMMNEKALSLGATGSHFTNPHGYHDPEHYTTAYDMYLILNHAITNELFASIFKETSYTATFKATNGELQTAEWISTNKYKNGQETAPEGFTVLGGKTGTTYDAGYCLVMLAENPEGQLEILEVFKSDARINLYLVMNQLMRFYGS